MTKRTSAATAAPLPLEIPDRRTILAGAAAVLAAIGTPAAAGSAGDPDAPLMALRLRWLAARAAFAAEITPRTPEELAILAAAPHVPSVGDHDEIAGAMAARIAALAPLSYPPVSAEAEARKDAALDAEEQAIAEIVALPARTLAGLGFKVEVSAANDHMSPELVASIMADVAALAAAQPSVRA